MTALIRRFRLALSTLSLLPAGEFRSEIPPADLAGSRWFYPAVGLLLGAILAAESLGLGRLGVPRGPACWLLVVSGAVLTGGLHLDGLADSFDGLFLPGGAERRLAVMRDPRAGPHGVAAVVLVIAGKLAALAEMGDRRRALTLLGAVAVSRTLVLLAAGSARYARPEGTGRFLIDATTPVDAALAAVLAILLGGASGGLAGLVAATVAGGVALGLAQGASSRLGGITGDILGAVVELSELAFLLTMGSLDGLPVPNR